MIVTHMILRVAALKRIPPFTDEERNAYHEQRRALISTIKNVAFRESGLEALEAAKDYANLGSSVIAIDLLRHDIAGLKKWLEEFESILRVSLTFLFEDGTAYCFVDGKDAGDPPHPDLSLPDFGKAKPITDEERPGIIQSEILYARQEASKE